MKLNCHKTIRVLEVLVVVSLLITAGCGASKKNCPSGQYEAKPVGDCNGPGICTDRPEACPYLWAPVCGCDGNTYGNGCEAAAAGVNVASEGECKVICNSNADITDPANYCEKQAGDCDGLGSPAAKPNACPDIWEPVCGCNGNTYGNNCEASAAGVNVKSEGACPVICNSNADITNPDNYCAKQDGDCDGPGSPTIKPEACPAVWDPVCGCDGTTYGNTCEAAVNGINIASEGACP